MVSSYGHTSGFFSSTQNIQIMITLLPKNKKQIHRRRFLSAFLFLIAGMVLPATLLAQPTAGGEPSVLIPSQGRFWVNAQWSPDGQTLAFSAENFNGIWLANADGTQPRQLTDDMAAGFGFTWSPDSRFILARPSVMENRRRFQQVKLYDVQTLAAETLLAPTRSLHGLPSFTPDGSQVAMVVDRKLEIKSSARLSQSPNANPAVVYAIDGRLINANLITRSDAEITAFDGRFIFNVRISPDRQRVVFQVQGKGLYVLNTDGSGLTHLGHGEYASWMPDNRHVVVSLVEDNGQQITGGDLYAVDVTTGQSYLLTGHTSLTALKPAVSPCGAWVVFDNPDDGNLYIMALQ